MIFLKIEYINDDCFIICLNKFYLKEAHFEDKMDLELYFKSFFLKLKKYYGIKMEGFYIIDVYKDVFYGMILKIRKEDFDYFDCDIIDMKLRIKNITLLYEIEEESFPHRLIKRGKFYKEGSHLYYKLEKDIPGVLLGMLEENTKLIIDTETILKYAKEIDSEVIYHFINNSTR